MPKDDRPLYEKHGDKLRFLVLISFALIVASIFWNRVRNKILFTSCSQIALNSTHVKLRTNLLVDSEETYAVDLYECLINAEAISVGDF